MGKGLNYTVYKRNVKGHWSQEKCSISVEVKNWKLK